MQIGVLNCSASKLYQAAPLHYARQVPCSYRGRCLRYSTHRFHRHLRRSVMVKTERSPSSKGRRVSGSQSRLQRWTAERRQSLALSHSQPSPKRRRHLELRRPRYSLPHHSSQPLPRRHGRHRHSLSVIRQPSLSLSPEPEPEPQPEPNVTPRASQRWTGDRIDIYNLSGCHIVSIPMEMLEEIYHGGARWEHVIELLERVTCRKAGRIDPLRPRRAAGACPPFSNADRGEYLYVTGLS